MRKRAVGAIIDVRKHRVSMGLMQFWLEPLTFEQRSLLTAVSSEKAARRAWRRPGIQEGEEVQRGQEGKAPSRAGAGAPSACTRACAALARRQVLPRPSGCLAVAMPVHLGYLWHSHRDDNFVSFCPELTHLVRRTHAAYNVVFNIASFKKTKTR